MRNGIVRIESIEIRNFKNVGYGYLNFENSRKGYKASILGLYGQNGSGKTALIEAIELLHLCLTGRTIPASFADFVNVDNEFTRIKYEFKVQNLKEQSSYSAFYEVSLRRDIDESTHNTEQPVDDVVYKATLFDEVLSYSYKCGDKKTRLSPIIDTRTLDDVVFVPTAKYNAIIGKDKETETSLLVAKQIARATSRSFVFSRELLNRVRLNCKEDYLNCKCAQAR